MRYRTAMRKAVLVLILVAAPMFGQIRGDEPVAPVVFGAGPVGIESARVASDGRNFFAVWRTRTPSGLVVIGGGRISPAGEALEQPSILFDSGSPDTLGSPDVVFVGENFLVAYQSGSSVLLRRVTRDGQPDPAPVVISNSGMATWLATNGKTVLLATARNRIRMLAADGTPIGEERDVPNAGYPPFYAGSNGDRYLIAYRSASDGSLPASFVLLEGNGDFLLTQPIPLAGPDSPRTVNVASNGSSFLISMATDSSVGCVAVDSQGNAGTVQALDSHSGGAVATTWSGSEYTLVWARTLDIVGARVDSSGAPLDATPVPIASWPSYAQRYGAVFGGASNGKDTIIITGDQNGNSDDWHTTGAIFTSLVQLDSEPANRRHVAIANSAREQASGSIASNRTLSLVTWRESSGLDQAVVRAAFIAADGQLGAPIDLGDAHPQSGTAVASNGRDFLVAYFDSNYHLVARRVTLEGLTDPNPIVISPYGTPSDAPAIGWSGRSYVVVTAGGTVVTVAGISAEGTVIVPQQLIKATQPADTPAVSCGASGCSVTWHTFASFCCEGGTDGFNELAFTDTAGTVLSHVLLTNTGYGVTPVLSVTAADGESMFIYSSGKTMYAGRITAEGTILDPPALNGGLGVITSTSAGSPQPIAAVNAGLYWVELSNSSTGRLYWSRIDPEPRPHV
ncbi:MAG TPA: hypothetical protein VLC46_04765, partial [Thermoanaerobaculia bacterium]|nr:hypothetical protein [Thermoanaerobaculia bacterium]